MDTAIVNTTNFKRALYLPNFGYPILYQITSYELFLGLFLVYLPASLFDISYIEYLRNKILSSEPRTTADEVWKGVIEDIFKERKTFAFITLLGLVLVLYFLSIFFYMVAAPDNRLLLITAVVQIVVVVHATIQTVLFTGSDVPLA